MEHKESSRLKKVLFFFGRLARDQSKWKLFQEFLSSPLHGNSKSNASLLGTVKQVLEMDGKSGEAHLCRVLFPGQPINAVSTRRRLYRRLSDLINFYYDFESLMRFKTDPMMNRQYLVQTANEEKWDQYFPTLMDKAVDGLDDLPMTSLNLFHRMLLEDQNDRFLNRQARDASRVQDRYLSELNALENLFTLNTLILACNIHNQQLQLDGPGKEIPFLGMVLERVEQDIKSQLGLIRIYYLIFKGLTDPGRKEYYRELKQFLIQSTTKLNRTEGRRIYQHVTNYCVRHHNEALTRGDQEEITYFQMELMAHYDYMLASGYLFTELDGEECIDHPIFVNIVVLFCRMKQFAWVERFIEAYGMRITKPLGQAVNNIANGIRLFYKGKFRDARRNLEAGLQTLRKRHDHDFTVEVMRYLLRSLFEVGEVEDCIRAIENFQKVLLRNTLLSKEVKERNKRFNLYLKRLCNLVNMHGHERIMNLERLSALVLEGPPVSTKSWLSQKINDLMGK